MIRAVVTEMVVAGRNKYPQFLVKLACTEFPENKCLDESGKVEITNGVAVSKVLNLNKEKCQAVETHSNLKPRKVELDFATVLVKDTFQWLVDNLSRKNMKKL